MQEEILECAHKQKFTTEHTCLKPQDKDCLRCNCCSNCREDVDIDDLCADCQNKT